MRSSLYTSLIAVSTAVRSSHEGNIRKATVEKKKKEKKKKKEEEEEEEEGRRATDLRDKLEPGMSS